MATASDATEEDHCGYLDYSEIYTSRQEEVSAVMNVIGESVARLGVRAAEGICHAGLDPASMTVRRERGFFD